MHCAYPVISTCCPVLVVSCLCCMHGMWSRTVHLWGCDIIFTYFLPWYLFLQWSQAGHWSLRCAYCSKKVEKRNMNAWAWQHRHTVHNHVPFAKHREQGTSSMWGSYDMYAMKRTNLSTSTYIQVHLTKWRKKKLLINQLSWQWHRPKICE